MGRKRRSINTGGIVIICEGTDTEYQYIRDAVMKALELDVFPFNNKEPKILQSAQDYLIEHPEDKALKKMMGNAKELRYFSKIESTKDLYDKYCKQPTRYLREAQLFVEQDFFEEGWGVYDLDHHVDHKGAIDLLNSDSRLHVAFSSYSFEEWLLTHFERNPKAFGKSECKDERDRIVQCGPNSGHPLDCYGNCCLGGYLRHKGHIPNYSKSGVIRDAKGKVLRKVSYFNKYSIAPDGSSLNEIMLINAAWHRSRVKGDARFETDPYSDVGKLLQRIFDDHRDYVWMSLSTISDSGYSINGGNLKIKRDSGVLSLSYNGKSGLLINPSEIRYHDSVTMNIHASSPQITKRIHIIPGVPCSLHDLPGSLLHLVFGLNHLIVDLK